MRSVAEATSEAAHLRFYPAVLVLNVAFSPALICDFLHGHGAILVFRRLGYRIEMVNSDTVETTGGLLSGVATFKYVSGGFLQTATGVLPSQMMQFATIPVDENYSQSRYAAYALANPTNQNLKVKLCLVDENDNLVETR